MEAANCMLLASLMIISLQGQPNSLTQNVYEINKVQTIYDIYNEEELTLLFNCVENEVHGGDYNSKKNVASVVFNRSEIYNQSLKEVLIKPNQFTIGKYHKISEETIMACEDALYNRGNVSEALFFRRTNKPPEKDIFCGRNVIYIDNVQHHFY